MTKLRLIALVGAAAGVPLALLAACSSDDEAVTVNPPDGGVDSPAATDAGKDTNNNVDGDKPDTNPPFDAGLKPETFADTLASTLCDALTRCCFGAASVQDGGTVDGGHFNRGRCLNAYRSSGFESSLFHGAALQFGNVTLDQVKGDDCLKKIQAMACDLTGASLKAIRAACFGALTGTVAENQPCRTSLECTPGHFCNPVNDGGVADAGSAVYGKCAPLRGAGDPCNITGDTQTDFQASLFAEEACSYRGGGDTNRRCASYDPDTDSYKPRDEWTCQSTVPNDAGCNTTVWCSDGICPIDAPFVCQTPLNYFGSECAAYVLP